MVTKLVLFIYYVMLGILVFGHLHQFIGWVLACN